MEYSIDLSNVAFFFRNQYVSIFYFWYFSSHNRNSSNCKKVNFKFNTKASLVFKICQPFQKRNAV